jgi:hypothetical protein
VSGTIAFNDMSTVTIEMHDEFGASLGPNTYPTIDNVGGIINHNGTWSVDVGGVFDGPLTLTVTGADGYGSTSTIVRTGTAVNA